MSEKSQLVPAQSDRQLWIQLKAGSELAFSRIVKLYFRQLVNYGHKFVRDEEFIKDSVQEVFIEIWKRRDRINVPDSVKAYLLSSVRRKLYRVLSRQKLVSGEFEVDFANDSSLTEDPFEWMLIEAEEEKQIQAKVNVVLDELPARQREAVYLQYFQNMTREEIAETMGINPQSVSNLLQAAFKFIRTRWDTLTILCVMINSSPILTKFSNW